MNYHRPNYIASGSGQWQMSLVGNCVRSNQCTRLTSRLKLYRTAFVCFVGHTPVRRRHQADGVSDAAMSMLSPVTGAFGCDGAACVHAMSTFSSWTLPTRPSSGMGSSTKEETTGISTGFDIMIVVLARSARDGLESTPRGLRVQRL